MGISASSCQACCLPRSGGSYREEGPLWPSASQKENCLEEGCLGEAGGPARHTRWQLHFCQVCLGLSWATSVLWGLTDSSVSSYLSHSCLQDPEPCLRFQFRLHQLCREYVGQALSIPMWSPSPCHAIPGSKHGPMWAWTISRGASATGLGISY